MISREADVVSVRRRFGNTLRGIALVLLLSTQVVADEQPINLAAIAPDLTTPPMIEGPPAAGKRVKHVLPDFANTGLFHALYLPTDWTPAKKFPVIVEYPGNGPYRNQLGDTNSGRLEDCNIGYGVSAGRGFIWVCLPFVNSAEQSHQLQWWGDADATAKYCQATVANVCEKFGGDRSRLVLAGFSRGAIACNYIGLRNDEIAKLWRAFIVHSHYDGPRRWPYTDSDAASALQRLARLGQRPQWISHEANVADTRKFLADHRVDGNFTFVSLPFPNHTDGWTLRDVPPRRQLRAWLEQALATDAAEK